MKILVLALSGIGDALMFTPALKLLRQSVPSAQIDALVMFKGTKEIYQNNPALNQVIHFDFLKEGLFKSLKFVLSLRKKYDATINVYPSNRKEYNIINFLLGAKQRVGVKYLRMNFPELGWLNNVTVLENDKTHNVQTNIKLIEKLLNRHFDEEPALQIFLSDNDNMFAEKYLKENKIAADDFVVGFHPGCATLKNHIKRRWEPEKFAELGKRLIKDKSAKIFLFGGPEEEELKESISKIIDSEKSFIIKTEKFLQSIAIMKRCNVFVTNDSALMHIASALGLKVVAIIGPTNEYYIHPWKTEYKIASLYLDCSPCFFYSPKPLTCSRTDVKFKCIKELSVDMVLNKVNEFINEN
ncbi:MAG TPA: glycosyltransferase family 9 protein [Ignavibacteriaceae bacterium]|jgi:heptosyltransferase-2|nr:MAG: ADP-heptose--LPS heptosyltransferase 2 [Ignavibacteria bacterium ADurb.Bin266]HQI42332.1 glycosyltransferase family 9 protein [Ignavibacteriaceae bacterium]HQJ45278.1 glycosyltransferase family 9 protein [Ignavibacteriaceae bacterium]